MSKLMRSISGIRGIVGDTLTPQVLQSHVRAFLEITHARRIVIGRDKTYERIKTGHMSDEFRTPCYEDFHFPNRIVVKTKKQYADGDAFDEPYLRYEGVQSFKGEKGRSMSLHVFSPYVIPEKLRW